MPSLPVPGSVDTSQYSNSIIQKFDVARNGLVSGKYKADQKGFVSLTYRNYSVPPNSRVLLWDSLSHD